MQGSGFKAAAGIIARGPELFSVVNPGFPEKKMRVVGHGLSPYRILILRLVFFMSATKRQVASK